MVGEPSPVLSPADRGRMGARQRWAGHARRVVRLDELQPAVAAAVRALVAADQAARKETVAVSETPATVESMGGTHDAASTD